MMSIRAEANASNQEHQPNLGQTRIQSKVFSTTTRNRSIMTAHRVARLGIAVTVFAAACGGGGGGGGGDSSSEPAESVDATESETEADADDASAEASEPDSTEPDSTEPESTEPAVVDDGGVSDIDVMITSDDGILEVFVPAGSGPADVTIEPIDVADGEVPGIGYALGPDGAAFSEPVTLTFTLLAADWVEGAGLPLLTFASDREDVGPPTISRDGDVVTVTADVEHFSEYYLFFRGEASAELSPRSLSVPANGSAWIEVLAVGFEPSDDVRPESVGDVSWSVDSPFVVAPDAGATSTREGHLAAARVSCPDPEDDAARLDVEFEFELPTSGVTNLLFPATTSHIRLDGSVSCVSTAAPYDVFAYGDSDDIPDIVGAFLGETDEGYSLTFFADGAPSTNQVVLSLEAVGSDGSELVLECPRVADDNRCNLWQDQAGGAVPVRGEFKTHPPVPGAPMIFDVLDVELDADGVLSLKITTTDSAIEPGLYRLTRIGTSINTDDYGGQKSAYFDPGDVRLVARPR